MITLKVRCVPGLPTFADDSTVQQAVQEAAHQDIRLSVSQLANNRQQLSAWSCIPDWKHTLDHQTLKTSSLLGLSTYLYLWGVRQKSLHRPLTAGSGSSMSKHSTICYHWPLKNIIIILKLIIIIFLTFTLQTLFQLAVYFPALLNAGCSHFNSKFLQRVWNLKTVTSRLKTVNSSEELWKLCLGLNLLRLWWCLTSKQLHQIWKSLNWILRNDFKHRKLSPQLHWRV